MSILDEIFEHKKDEVARLIRTKPLAAVRREAEAAERPPDFLDALRSPGRSVPALIAEVKRRSPSRGLLAPEFDPLWLARVYQENGAAAVSVLTDERYFGGSLEDLRRVADVLLSNGGSPPLPILRKDFICDPYQIYEARSAGAAAILLIAAALSPAQLRDLHALAVAIGLLPLVEVHCEAELEAALTCHPRLIGINNRDLHTFTVNLATTLRLKPRVPAGIAVVAESGINTAADIARLAAAGVEAVLVGEALVRAADPAARVRELAGTAGLPVGIAGGGPQGRVGA